MPRHFNHLGFMLALSIKLQVRRTSPDSGGVSSRQKEGSVNKDLLGVPPPPTFETRKWNVKDGRGTEECKGVRPEETLSSWWQSHISVHPLPSWALPASAAYPTFIYLNSAPTEIREDARQKMWCTWSNSSSSQECYSLNTQLFLVPAGNPCLLSWGKPYGNTQSISKSELESQPGYCTTGKPGFIPI